MVNTAFMVMLLSFSQKHISEKVITPHYNNIQVECLADNVYFESVGESEPGQTAVALVTMNRVNSGQFPDTVCEVVREKRNKCQFSWWCDYEKREMIAQVRSSPEYQKIKEKVTNIYHNYDQIKDITNGSLYYHSKHISSKKIGLKKLKLAASIGRHKFYKI
jgi:spore germination cell wall hydrolase CwlJ-like protein